MMGRLVCRLLTAALCAHLPLAALSLVPREGYFRIEPEGGVPPIWNKGQQIPANITAVHPNGTIDTSFNGDVSLTGVTGPGPTTFIDGPMTLPGPWTENPASTATNSIVNDGPSGTALFIDGGRNVDTKGNLWAEFTSSEWESLSFYAKAGQTNLGGPEIFIEEITGSGLRYDAVKFQFRSDGQITIANEASGQTLYPLGAYEANRWYKIDLEFDWSIHKTRVYVDDEVRGTVRFAYGTSTFDFSRINVYNWAGAGVTSWIADMRLVRAGGAETGLGAATVSPTSVTLVNGAWSGVLSALPSTVPQTDFRFFAKDGSPSSGTTLPRATIQAGCGPGQYSITAGGSCLGCAPGTAVLTEGTVGSCPLCPVGQFQNQTNQTTCSLCPANTFRATEGATSPADCIPCSAGDTSAPGSETCRACPVGEAKGGVNNTCVNCGAGKLSDGSGCQDCPAGTWQTAPAGLTCTPCGTGTGVATPGSQSAAACQTCGAGSYNDGNTGGLCAQCPPGQWSDGTDPTACSACPAGTYSTVPGLTAPTQCTPCAEGSASLTNGSSTPCPQCLPGTSASGTGNRECTTCPARTYAVAGSATCLPCGGGTFSNATGAGACTRCDEGTYLSPPTGSLGSAGPCFDCLPGTYSSLGASVCSPCPVGTFSTAVRAPTCQTCPPKQTTKESGATECVDQDALEDTGAALGPAELGLVIGIVGAVFCVVIIFAVAIIVFLRRHHERTEKMLAEELATRPPSTVQSTIHTPARADSAYMGIGSGESYRSVDTLRGDSGSGGLADRLSDVRPDLSTQTVSVGDFDVSTEVNPDEVDLTNARVLGNGAYGIVYLASYRGEPVAVKEIRQDAVTLDEMGKFIEEAQLMHDMVPHPNILAFRGIVKDPFCLVVEFIDGGDLEDLLQKQHRSGTPLGHDKELSIFLNIARGMSHLAKQGILHRDLAARNVLVTADLAQVKLADFGLSRLCDPSSVVYSKSDVGPLKWMAPEAIRKKKYSEKSDVWSFGIVCREVITMQEPYPDMDAVQAATEVCAGFMDMVLPPETHPAFVPVLTPCTTIDPEERPTFEELVVSLEAVSLA